MNPFALEKTLHDRLLSLEERLTAACRRAGRKRAEVTLIAVTKTITFETASRLPALGVSHLGESRPQELWRKATSPQPSPPGRGPGEGSQVHWHLVGHLQRNKIERTLPLVHLIHSVDSPRLLQALDREAGKQGRMVDVLLEVNAGGEASKLGFRLQEVASLLPALGPLKHVQVRGLMTMAALEVEAEKCRPTFVALRQLRDRFQKEIPSPHTLVHLSMGMSNDFEVAVEEGATYIRLGTVLFQGLDGGEA